MRVFLPAHATDPSAAVWIGLLVVVVGITAGRAIVRPENHTLLAAAWAALLGTILVDATLVAFVRSLPLSLPVAALVLPALYTRRLLESAEVPPDSAEHS
jgi:hypothetical protein